MVGRDRGVMEVKVVCSEVCRVVDFRIFVSRCLVGKLVYSMCAYINIQR